MTLQNHSRLDGPDVAADLRRLISSLWISLGEDVEMDAETILRTVSRQVEIIARTVEAA